MSIFKKLRDKNIMVKENFWYAIWMIAEKFHFDLGKIHPSLPPFIFGKIMGSKGICIKGPDKAYSIKPLLINLLLIISLIGAICGKLYLWLIPLILSILLAATLNIGKTKIKISRKATKILWAVRIYVKTWLYLRHHSIEEFETSLIRAGCRVIVSQRFKAFHFLSGGKVVIYDDMVEIIPDEKQTEKGQKNG